MGAAKLLHSQGLPVSVIERGVGPALEKQAEPLRQQGIEVVLGLPLRPESFQRWRGALQMVVISPGIALSLIHI